ncbi:MAG: hypothetical protein PHI97_10745 [Desulfobulbus sp.]|nr:hypothetical protein [Desulfobulbus sp.]
MNDTELQGIVLHKYYERRREDMFCPTPDDFSGQLSMQEILAISKQLGEQGLIEWKSISPLEEETGYGKISSPGIDKIEGKDTPANQTKIVHNTSVTISNASNIRRCPHLVDKKS